jgi:hypothetical protein
MIDVHRHLEATSTRPKPPELPTGMADKHGKLSGKHHCFHWSVGTTVNLRLN